MLEGDCVMNELKENYSSNDFPIEVDVQFHQPDDDGEDVAYFEILNINHLIAINRLAAELYSMKGRIFLPDMDFYSSNHPEEIGCFYMACLAFYLVPKEGKL
jgi:hypothetical protein